MWWDIYYRGRASETRYLTGDLVARAEQLGPQRLQRTLDQSEDRLDVASAA